MIHKTGCIKHGHAPKGLPSRTYTTWANMLQRCLNPKSSSYTRYGGRGIVPCERWLNFENFLEDMGERPLHLSLDRINNNGNYEPTNCRWATDQEQRCNTRSSHIISWWGTKDTVTAWATYSGINHQTIGSRLKAGWSVWAALMLPPQRKAA